MADDVSAVVIHAADLHLGAPLRSLGAQVSGPDADQWRALAATALDQLVELAFERQADAVVLAGDIYDGADREVSAQLRFGRALRRLTDAGIPVFVAHGNHDPLAASFRPAMTMPDGVTVFAPGDVQVHPVTTRRGDTVFVAGVSFSDRHERQNLAARFAGLGVPAERSVAVLHANVDGVTGHDPYAPCSVADLERAPIAYWALGHVHQRTVVPMGPGRWWAYPGNLQGRATNASECGPKGALVVTFDAGGVREPEFVPCDGVRFERVDVDVSAAHDLGGAFDLLRDAGHRFADGASPRPLLLRARLVGASDAHHALLASSDKLLHLAREHLGDALAPGELLRLEVATRPSIERSQLLDRGDLASAVLRRLDELRSDRAAADVLSGLVGEPAIRALRDHAARRGLDVLSDPSLLDRVEQLLVARLVEP